MAEETPGNSGSTPGQGGVVSKTWTSNEPFEPPLRWGMTFYDGITCLEVESDSLRAVVRMMFYAWRRRNRDRKRQPRWARTLEKWSPKKPFE